MLIRLECAILVGILLCTTVHFVSPTFVCEQSGLYPHPNSCTKFIQCDGRRKFEMDCAPGTHFNSMLGVCDWPSSAGCQVPDPAKIEENLFDHQWVDMNSNPITSNQQPNFDINNKGPFSGRTTGQETSYQWGNSRQEYRQNPLRTNRKYNQYEDNNVKPLDKQNFPREDRNFGYGYSNRMNEDTPIEKEDYSSKQTNPENNKSFERTNSYPMEYDQKQRFSASVNPFERYPSDNQQVGSNQNFQRISLQTENEEPTIEDQRDVFGQRRNRMPNQVNVNENYRNQQSTVRRLPQWPLEQTEVTNEEQNIFGQRKNPRFNQNNGQRLSKATSDNPNQFDNQLNSKKPKNFGHGYENHYGEYRNQDLFLSKRIEPGNNVRDEKEKESNLDQLESNQSDSFNQKPKTKSQAINQRPNEFNTTKTNDKMNYSYVIYEDEVQDDTDESRLDIKQLPTCDDDEGQLSNDKPLCTLNAFHWLQLADTEIESDKLIREAQLGAYSKENVSKVSGDCHRTCLNESDHNVRCVAYTYSFVNRDCLMYYEIELETNWLDQLNHTVVKRDSNSKMKSFKPRKDYFSRFTVPTYQLMLGQWLISENSIPEFKSGQQTSNKKAELKQKSKYISLRNKSFFDCFNVCAESENCGHFMYHSFDERCVVKENIESGQNGHGEVESEETSEEGGKVAPSILTEPKLLRKGWLGGFNLNDPTILKSIDSIQNDELNHRWTFFEENNRVLLQLVEQLLLLEEDEFMKRNRYLNPIETLTSVSDLAQCRHKCVNSWSDETKKPCKFFAVRKNLLVNETTFECLLFDDNLINIVTKLLQIKQDNYDHYLSTIQKFYQNEQHQQEVSMLKKRDVGEDDFEIKAYLFNNEHSKIRFYQIKDKNTIENAVRQTNSLFMKLNGAKGEHKCFEKCILTWNIFNGDNNLKCRFMVLTSSDNNGERSFNCTFYYTDPTHQKFNKEIYEINSVPLNIPVSHTEAGKHFHLLKDNSVELTKDSNSVVIQQLNQINDVNQCLHRCLQKWMITDDHHENPCTHVIVYKQTDDNHVEIKCTLIHKIETKEKITKHDGNNSVKRSLFQLRQLAENISTTTDYEDLFDVKYEMESLDDKRLAQYEPLGEIENSNYKQCLRICLDLWASAKLGDPRKDRCRLVLIEKNEPLHYEPQWPSYKLYSYIPVYKCYFYDIELMKKPLLSNERYPLKIFKKLFEMDTDLNIPRYLPVSQPYFKKVLKKIVENSTAFYHHSRSVSPGQCTEACSNIKSYQSRDCDWIVARPLVEKELFDTTQIEYECLFYNTSTDVYFEFATSNRLEPRVYQLMRFDQYIEDVNQQNYTVDDNWKYFDFIESDSIPVNFVKQSYKPNLSVRNATSVEDCFQQCLHLHTRNNDTNHAFCKMIVFSPNIVLQGQVMNYVCDVYNFNASEYRLNDLDNKNVMEGYQLKWQDNGFFTFMIDMKQERLFEQIPNDRDVFTQLTSNRMAYMHLSSVSDKKDCFTICLDSWLQLIAYGGKNSFQNLCRFVMVRPVLDYKQNLTYDCAFYETNVTKTLVSMNIIVNEPKFNKDNENAIWKEQFKPKPVSELFPSNRESLYKAVDWPINAPYESDRTKVLNRPADLNHCLDECDSKLSQCQAILTNYNRNKLVQCFFIGHHEYVSNSTNGPLPNHSMKLFVKLTNFSNRKETDTINGDKDYWTTITMENAYLTLIESIRNYDQNEPFVSELLNRLSTSV